MKIYVIIFSLLFISCIRTSESQNFEGLQKVKIGMNFKEANGIMVNTPKKIDTTYWNDSLFIHYYDSPAAASDDYGIVFSKKDSIVVEILLGD